ncbi:MAG: FG-GAP repeat protein [Chthoniobacteraceae bacterium]
MKGPHPMRSGIVLTFALAVVGHAVFGQVPDTLIHSIPPPLVGTAGGGRLGDSVAVEGDLIIAGASSDGTGGASSGIVKIFSASTGALLQVIPNPQPAANAFFGGSVAVSGTRVVVGGKNGVYVFDLKAADPASPTQRFDVASTAVAISGDAIVVGTGSAAFVYHLQSPTPSDPIATLNSSATHGFGNAVAIDGSHVVVGTGLSSSGAGRAFVFDLTGPSPGEPILSLSHPSALTNADFGRSVAVAGNRVVVGAFSDGSIVETSGAAFVYDLTSTTPAVPVLSLPNPNPQLGAGFGISVSLAGSRLLVGAFQGGTNLEGVAYVYDLSLPSPAASPVTLRRPTSTPTGLKWFGWSVALSETTAVAGAPNFYGNQSDPGSVFAFDLSAAAPSTAVVVMTSPGSSAGDQFGTAVALSGKWLAAGSPFESTGAQHAGAVYVYDLNSATPKSPAFVLHGSNPGAGAEFGSGVALSGDRLIVAAPGAAASGSQGGRVFVYDLNAASPETPIMTLAAPEPVYNGYSRFGRRTVVSGDRLFVTEYRYIEDPVVHVYDLSNTASTVPVATIAKALGSGIQSNMFGDAVAVSGQRVVVGAPYVSSHQFSKYLGFATSFDISGVSTSEIDLTPAGLQPNDTYGKWVAISGARVLVGAPGRNQTFLHDLASATPAQPVQVFPGARCVLSGSIAVIGLSIYDLASTSPTSAVATLTAPYRDAGESFGDAMAFDGARLAVGMPLADTVQVDKGYVYVFASVSPSSTLPPQLHEPVPHATIAGPIDISLTLPEAPLPGSVKLVLTGAETRILTLAASQETAGRRRFRVDPADLAAGSAVSRVEGGWSIPDGAYEVRVSYQDAKGNPAQSAAASDVFLDRSMLPQDTMPPHVEPVSSRVLLAGAAGLAALPDYRPLLRATDNIGVTRELQQPPPGTALGVGLYPITFSVRDAAGNMTTVGASVIVRSPTDTTPPTVAAVTLRGGPAPGAGTQPGVAAGALLDGFGVPAISDARDLAALVTVADDRKRLSAIYRENVAGAGEILAIQGGPVPGSGGAPLIAKSFLDPVLAPDGSAAFCGKIAGVKSAVDEAVWTDAFGSLQLVLREGAAIPGLPGGVTLKSVTSISLRNDALLALVKLNHAKGLVTALDDSALVMLTAPATGHLLARTGTSLRGAKIKTLTVLSAPLGSAGQGRAQNDAFVTAKATLDDKRVVLLSIAPDGTQTDLEGSGDDFSAIISGAKWAGFGPPAAGGTGNMIAAAAALKIGAGNITAKNDAGIAVGSGAAFFDLPIREGNLAPPGISDGPNYAAFFDPVVNAEGRIAFLATLSGGDVKGSNKTALFSGPPSAVKRIARLGAPALSATGDPLADAFWSGFETIALPDGGRAIFVAKLSGKGAKASDKLGLWAEDANGLPHLVLRTGSNIPLPGGGSKTLTSFELLDAPRGSFGARRSYNSFGSVAVRALFGADKSEALLRLDLP